jgi:antitoxin component YwqK of YwqJK toxin-antitoxin module
VAQDDDGNYQNHGTWKTWDNRGNLLAQGEFERGNRTGTWIRWYRNPSETPLLLRAPYSKFNPTFISQATFRNNQLDGTWTIYDGKKSKISQWEFREGKRHGTSTWWHSNGHKAREVQYRDGELHGQLLEWGPDGVLALKETYQGGRKLAPKVAAKFQDGAKKSEGMYLSPKEIEQTPDDWWNCKTQATIKQGKEERHGLWTTWYSNGQPQFEGSFEHDLQHGKFVWWHQNGQKALEGHFENGKQNGAWTWWYPTGQKSIRGEYANGNPTGRWTWWKEDGKVSQSADLSHGEGGIVVDTPSVEDLDGLPQATQPRARQLSR